VAHALVRAAFTLVGTPDVFESPVSAVGRTLQTGHTKSGTWTGVFNEAGAFADFFAATDSFSK